MVLKHKNIIFGMGVYLFLLLFLEGTARVGYKIFVNASPQSETWYVYSPELLWEPKPNFSGEIGHIHREFDSQGFLSVDTTQKDDSQKKILFIGDSNTFGFNVPVEATFVEILDRLTPQISMINLSVPGYTSYQGLQTLIKRGLKLDPHIVVVSFNFNDRRYVLSEAFTDNAMTFKKAFEKQNCKIKILEQIYIYRSMRFLFRKLGIIKDDHLKTNEVNLNDLYPRVSPANYRKNLARIIELARSKNTKVVFMLLKDNPIQTQSLKKGIAHLRNSQYHQAIEQLKKALEGTAWFSELARKYLSIAYARQGRPEKRDAISKTTAVISLHGAYPIYLDSEYNQIMLDVAQQYGLEVVNAGSALDQGAFYLDFCHPNPKGHQIIADLLHDKLNRIIHSNTDKTILSNKPIP